VSGILDLGTNTITDGNLTGAWTGITNLTATGTVQAEHLYTTDDLVVDGLVTIGETLGVTGITTLSNTLLMPGQNIGSVTSEIGHIYLGDAKYVNFGDDQDLFLGHTGVHATLVNKTGNLYVQVKDGENALVAVPDGLTQIYYNNAVKLATTATGISVTGAVLASSAIFGGEVEIDGPFNHDGLTFGALGAVPAVQQARIDDPGDLPECITAIGDIIDVLQVFGFVA